LSGDLVISEIILTMERGAKTHRFKSEEASTKIVKNVMHEITLQLFFYTYHQILWR